MSKSMQERMDNQAHTINTWASTQNLADNVITIKVLKAQVAKHEQMLLSMHVPPHSQETLMSSNPEQARLAVLP
jgi:hypothetical protein